MTSEQDSRSVSDSLKAAKMAKYSLVMTPSPTPCRVAGCIMSIRRTFSCVRALTCLLTYLHSWLGAYKTGNSLSPKRLKIERKLQLTAYIQSHTFFPVSIAAKMYDLEWPLSEIQGHWFLKCRKLAKYNSVMTPTPCRVAGGIISIRPTYLCARALTYLLTQNSQCFGDCRWPVSFLSFQRMICLPFHCLWWALK